MCSERSITSVMMKNIVLKKHLLAVTVILCITGSLWAQQLSPVEAQNRAVENSKSIEIAKNKLQKTINSAAVKSYLPTFSLSGSISENLDLTKDVSDSLKHPAIEISAGIKWAISNLDLQAKASNDISIKKDILTLEKTAITLRNSVITSYYKLVSLNESIRQSEKSVENAEFSYERTLEMYNNSKTTELSLLQAKMSYEDSLYSLESAKASYMIALDTFRDLTGIEEEFTLEKIPQTEGLHFEKLPEIAEKYLKDTTAIKSAQLDIESAEINGKNTIGKNKTPSVSLTSNLGYGLQNNRKDSFENSLNLSATVKATVPLDAYLPWTSSHASILNSEIDIDNAELTLASTVENLNSSISQSVSNIQTYKSKTDNLKAHLELSEQNYKLVTEAYENGYASYSDLNNARTTLEKAQVELTNNEMNIINQLCSFASLLELDLNSVMEYLK